MIRHLALFALAASTPVGAASLPRSFTITSFDRIRVEAPYAIELVTNRAPAARATGSTAQLDAIDLRVEGRTLIVRERGGWNRGSGGGPVAIKLSTPDLASAQLLGSGTLVIDRMRGLAVTIGLQGSGNLVVGRIEADRLNAAAEGSGELRLTGKVKVASLIARGSPTLNAADLHAAQATIAADGSAEVAARPLERADITAAGTAKVVLSNPVACTMKTRGSALVEGCKGAR